MTSDTASLLTPEVNVVSNAIYSALMGVMGLKSTNWITKSLYPFFASPVRRISTWLVEFDRNIVLLGWNQAVKQFLGYFVTHINLYGENMIPVEGPLLVVCNHPAAYDVVILAACIRRDDLMIMASDIPLIQKLPHIASHIIPVPYHIPARLQTVRASLQHLRSGGALLIFPRGNVEPDPAVSPGAAQSLSGWSASIELFLRKVPQTITTIAIARGILSGKWFRNPLIQRWKQYEQRQKVAEIFQIASQLLTGKKSPATPRVDFSAPLTVAELGGEDAPEGTLLASITEQARRLLVNHPQVNY